MMRIITGKARGVRLATLEGLTTRPTAEKVKEAIFSMIQFDIEGRRVLDIFAGSGQMALEALSRGAKDATLIDSSKEAAEIIRQNALKTKLFADLKLITCDYKTAIKQLAGQKFDIVFCDAPYAAKLTGDVIARLCDSDLLAPGATVICESDEEKTFENESLRLVKVNHYGRSYVAVYKTEVREQFI